MQDLSDTVVLKNIVHELISGIRKQDFLTYFKKISIVRMDATTVTFGVVSAFMRDNLGHKFYDCIRTATRTYLPTVESIEFVVDDRIETSSQEYSVDCQKEYREFNIKKKREDTTGMDETGEMVSRTMSEKYRLDNFIVGASNQLPHAAAEVVSRKPWSTYNPLYIWGGVGLGKTHLLQGIGNAIRERYGSKKKVIYMTADRFITDYVSAIKGRSMDKMQAKYRTIDVLIIDDVQFLENKKGTQEELYNIFNILYESGRQIILSGDRPPKELTELEPRLQSRFGCGLIADIGAPDYETRLAILQEKAHEKEFILPHDVAELVAHHVEKNVRDLEGILNQLIGMYDLHDIPPTMESVSALLHKLSITETLVDRRKKALSSMKSYHDLLDAVSSHFGIETTAILSEDRKKENMIPRQVAMYLLKTKMHFTYERIGNIFSGRNHSAVLYSCRKLESLIKKDQNLVYEINVIRSKLGL